MKATDFLQAAIDVQAQRGRDYDNPEGERSMAATVRAFNAITGRDLTEAEGWLILECLKNVRQWQQPGRYHHDSALDGVAYSALKAEALHAAGEQLKPTAPRWENWRKGDVVMVHVAGFGRKPGGLARIRETPTSRRIAVATLGAPCAIGTFDAADLSWHSRPEKAE